MSQCRVLTVARGSRCWPDVRTVSGLDEADYPMAQQQEKRQYIVEQVVLYVMETR